MLQGWLVPGIILMTGEAVAENHAPLEAAASESETAMPTDSAVGVDSESTAEAPANEMEEELVYGAVAEVQAPPTEPTRRTIEGEVLTRVPGTRGDALRAIEIMPGVSRTPYASNDGAPLLRGSPSDESIVLLDGATVPLIYHFGGLTSFFNSYLLEGVDLYPGNFSARYGRAAGGVVQARVRDPNSEHFSAMLELSAIDSFALAEGPIGKKTSVALAARRSNIDLFFSAMAKGASYSVLRAPVYWDYQAIFSHHFNDRHQLRVLGYGSIDQMEFFLDDAATGDPAVYGDVDLRTAFHRAQLELRSRFSDHVTQNLMVSVGPTHGDQLLGDLGSKFRFVDVTARGDWSFFLHPAVRLDTGIDFQMFAGTGYYTGPVPAQDEGNPSQDPLAGEEFVTIEEQGVTPVRPAAYLEASVQPTESWLIVPGVRLDYTGDGNDWTVDPRISTRYSVRDGTVLKAGVGQYSQPPLYFQIMDQLGNPDATPFRTIQSTLGVEQRIVKGVDVDVEGFYKYWHDRLVGTQGGEPPGFVNEGTGRAYGMEFLLNVRPSRRLLALASYTLSRSERQDGPEQPWRLFDSDQTHNLSLTTNLDLGHGWMIGARFRYVTGNPITPVIGAVYDASTDSYRALNGDVNSQRNPAFHQLDIRGEKRWDIGPVGLTVYLEIMNVYAHKNVEGVSYSYDFSETENAIGMPFFPNFGIRGEL